MLGRRCSIDDTASQPISSPVAQHTRVPSLLTDAEEALTDPGAAAVKNGAAPDRQQVVAWELKLEAMRQQLDIDSEEWAELLHVMESKPGQPLL